MKKQIVWGFALSLALAISSAFTTVNEWGLGNIPGPNNDTRDFTVKSFDRIKISETLNVSIKAGDAFAVQAIGRSEDINSLDVSVKKGELVVAYQPVPTKKNQDVVINRAEVQFRITLPALKQAEFQKASHFAINGFNKLETLALLVNSQANGTATVNADRLKINLNSQGALTLQGETAFLDAALQGQAKLTAFMLKTKQATLAVGGMSKANVFVSDKLQASVNGASELLYKGKPEAKVVQSEGSFIRESAD